ncbi:MAG: transcription antitermination protein NusB [Mycoplasmataceae bacterium]|nr:transcription antitermination protein NusB [Mycoplasmataceae bacterium]
MKIIDIMKLRENVIGYIYSYELLGLPVDSVKAFESGDFTKNQIKVIERIAANQDMYKKLITQFIRSGWTWERISVMSRSILMYGCYELAFREKALVINELIEYTKEYVPDDSYKFINPILENIWRYYETLKANKK